MENNLTLSGKLVLEQLGININNLLTDFPVREQRLQYRAVVQWFADYKPRLDATNLETVKGYLESFYHLCGIRDWERTWKILSVSFNTHTNKELHDQLNFWGEYHQQIQLYKQVKNQLSSTQNIKLLNYLGKAYFDLGDANSAEIEHKKVLELAQQLNDQQEKGLALRGLGKICVYRGDLSKAKSYFDQQLKIAETIGDKKQQIMAIQNIANVLLFSPNPQYSNIINLYEQSLKLCQEINDQESKAIALKKLGSCYDRLGENLSAFNYYREAIKVYEEIEDFRNVKSLNFEFGNLCARESNFQDALIHFEKYLSFFEESDREYDSQKFMEIYMNLSGILCQMYRHQEAIEYSYKHLNLANKPDEKYFAFFCLGNIYSSLEQSEEALEKYISALQLATEINNLELIIDILINMAHCYNNMGSHKYALKYSNKARKKSYNLADDRNGRDRLSYALGEFGVACRELGKYDIALRTITHALEIAVESNDKLNEAVQKRDLGLIYSATGAYTQALSYLCDSQEMLQNIYCPEEEFITLIAISQTYLKLSDYDKSLLYYSLAKNTASKLSPICQVKCDCLKQLITGSS